MSAIIIHFPTERTWAYIEKQMEFSAIDFVRKLWDGQEESMIKSIWGDRDE